MLRYLSGGRGRKGCRVTPSRRVARVSRVGVQRVVDSICCTVTLLALSVASGSCSGDDRQPAAATSAGPTVLHDTLTPVTAPGPVQFQDAASRPPGLHHGFLHASASRRARLVGTADLTCGSRQVPAALYEYALTLPRPFSVTAGNRYWVVIHASIPDAGNTGRPCTEAVRAVA
jgi:hypothetical protein